MRDKHTEENTQTHKMLIGLLPLATRHYAHRHLKRYSSIQTPIIFLYNEKVQL